MSLRHAVLHKSCPLLITVWGMGRSSIIWCRNEALCSYVWCGYGLSMIFL